jgi:phosphoribosylglycinamide formyltransferase 1
VKLGVLVSGRGSNLEAVLDAVAAGHLPQVEPMLVISNRPGVRALEVASQFGTPSLVLDRDAYPDLGTRDGAIGLALARAECDLALLAGYDQVLRPPYFAAFGGQTINIHPSLLPRHGGKGMVGLAVHRAVLAAGDRETGVTIHRVTQDLDAGPLLAQVRVAVLAGEGAEALARRVLAVEHQLLVETLGRLAAEGLPDKASASMTGAPGVTDAPVEEA